MKVLIVGAGPTGLTAGVELARLGVDATVIERRESESNLSRAVGIIPYSLKLLEPSGVTARLLAEGIKTQSAKIYLGDTLTARIPLQIKNPRYGYGTIIMLPQDQTEAALQDKFIALGGTVRYGTAFETLVQDDSGVTATLAGGKMETYDYVIGADGIHSQVRTAIGVDYLGHDLPEEWSIADVDCDGWTNREDFTICVLPKGDVAVVAPLAHDRCRVISNTPNALNSLPLPMTVTRVRREGTFKISIRQVTDYRKGRVFLCGDAAHCHSPVGGRGMNLGIADAASAAQCIATGAIENYAENRHREGATTIKNSERARKFITTTNPAKRLILRAAFKAVGASDFLRTRLIKTILYG